MYAMRLDMTLYACGTKHRQGRHLKYNCIINIVIDHNIFYSSSLDT